MTAKLELPFVACVLRAAQIPYTPRPRADRKRARVKGEPKRKRPEMAAYMRAWRRRNQGVADEDEGGWA